MTNQTKKNPTTMSRLGQRTEKSTINLFDVDRRGGKRRHLNFPHEQRRSLEGIPLFVVILFILFRHV